MIHARHTITKKKIAAFVITACLMVFQVIASLIMAETMKSAVTTLLSHIKIIAQQEIVSV
jgi:hypothetical protein